MSTIKSALKRDRGEDVEEGELGSEAGSPEQKRPRTDDSESESSEEEYNEEELSKLTEIERERILAEKYERQKKKEERAKLKRLSSAAPSSKPADRILRDRSKKPDTKSAALQALVERRARVGTSAPAGSPAPAGSAGASESMDVVPPSPEGSDASSDSSSGSDSDSGSGSESSRSRSRSRSRHREHSSSSHRDRDRNDSRDRQRDSDRDNIDLCDPDKSAIAQLTRDTLLQWVDEVFFAETVKGFFVRVNIGKGPSGKPTYNIALIHGVKDGPKDYTVIKADGKKATCRTLLELMMPTTRVSKDFRIEFVSNKCIEKTEFEQYIRRLKRVKDPAEYDRFRLTQTMLEALSKKREEAKIRLLAHTDQDVNDMVKRKKKLGQMTPAEALNRRGRLAIAIKNLTELIEQDENMTEMKRGDLEEDLQQKSQELEAIDEHLAQLTSATEGVSKRIILPPPRTYVPRKQSFAATGSSNDPGGRVFTQRKTCGASRDAFFGGSVLDEEREERLRKEREERIAKEAERQRKAKEEAQARVHEKPKLVNLQEEIASVVQKEHDFDLCLEDPIPSVPTTTPPVSPPPMAALPPELDPTPPVPPKAKLTLADYKKRKH
eukprot:m51a1_g63 putative rna polymerase-associated protein rtf1 homolog (608) ;mRNA; r:210605-213113